jgi:hypothetical protein
MRMRHFLSIATLALVASCATLQDGPDRSEREAAWLHDAVHQLTSVIVYDIFSPPQASRVYAYASIAAFEALRPQDTSYRSLAGQLNGLTPAPFPEPDSAYYLPLSAVHAYLTVGRALTFSQARMDSVRAAMHAVIRREGLDEDVFERSVAYGDAVAAHVLSWATQDFFLQSRSYPKYTVTSDAGRWVPTPPAYMDAVEPNWARLRPFALDSAGQFKPRPPHPFDTASTSEFYRQLKDVYDTGVNLTEEQRAIAAFWDCNPYVMNVRGHAMFATKKITPGGHWMGIVGIAARKADASMLESAAAYARTAVALADGFISAWEEKYRSNVVRPETLINLYLDDAWQPLLQTPPFPEYTSGHSVISTAAAVVLTDHFGPDFSFADSTELEYGLPVRSFASFEQAAAEAAISRLYGGIHYRMAIEEGVTQGRLVGQQVVQRTKLRGGRTVVNRNGRTGNEARGS